MGPMTWPKKALAGFLFLSCAPPLALAGCDEDACSEGQCEGDDGSCMSCESPYFCTTTPSGNCSDPVKGVYCCDGAGGGGNDDGSCPSGYCYTGVSCCPTAAPWQGGNSCFATSDDCHAAGYSTCYGC